MSKCQNPPLFGEDDSPPSASVDVDFKSLYRPKKSDYHDEDLGFGGNHEYSNLSGLDISHLNHALYVEKNLIAEIRSGRDYEDANSEIRSKENDILSSEYDGLYGLDIGIASAVVSISCLGGVPFLSCSGGGLGGVHRYRFPLVAFYADKNVALQTIFIANQSDVGLRNSHEGGYLILYGSSLYNLLTFAENTQRYILNRDK